ncbi:MAG: RNA ligase family protein, partial [Cyanobacteria bacterium J06633_1]
NNCCLGWSETEEWAAMLGLELPVVLYRGIWNEDKIKAIAENIDLEKCEGFVVRNIEPFPYQDFSNNVAKWVRSNHVQTDTHWMHREVIPNRLK